MESNSVGKQHQQHHFLFKIQKITTPSIVSSTTRITGSSSHFIRYSHPSYLQHFCERRLASMNEQIDANRTGPNYVSSWSGNCSSSLTELFILTIIIDAFAPKGIGTSLIFMEPSVNPINVPYSAINVYFNALTFCQTVTDGNWKSDGNDTTGHMSKTGVSNLFRNMP